MYRRKGRGSIAVYVDNIDEALRVLKEQNYAFVTEDDLLEYDQYFDWFSWFRLRRNGWVIAGPFQDQNNRKPLDASVRWRDFQESYFCPSPVLGRDS